MCAAASAAPASRARRPAWRMRPASMSAPPQGGGGLPEQYRARLLVHRALAAPVLLAARIGALRGRTRADVLEPALHLREVVEPHALPFPRHDPRIRRHVGDAVVVAADVAPAREPAVEHAVEPFALPGVALDGVGDALRRVDVEMVVLAEHRPQSRHLPEQPFQAGAA